MFSCRQLFFLPLFLLGVFVTMAAPADAQLLSDEREVSYPALGTWNGFLEHQEILECSNFSTQAMNVTVTMFNSAGGSMGQNGFAIASRGSFHFILNAFFNIVDSYGTFRVDVDQPTAAKAGLRCVLMTYRFARVPSPAPVAYSYAIPVISPIHGVTSGLFNSLNPLGDFAAPVNNFLTVANPSTSPFSATVEMYDATGAFIGTQAIPNLPPNARLDLPLGHPSGKVVGMYRIVPSDRNQRYLAYLIQYAPGTADFFYAYVLQASPGSCSGEPLFVSTMGPALSWVQFGNPGASSLGFTVEVRDSSGNVVHTESKSLPPHGHEHVLMNAYLGDFNLGTVRGTCASGSLLVQGSVYGRTAPGGAVAWAYSNQIRDLAAGAGELVVQPFNSFLGVLSWLRSTSVVAGGSEFTTQVRTSSSEAQQLSAFAAFGGSTDLPAFSLAAANRIGNVASAATPAGRSITSELLRVYPLPDARLGYVTLVPPAIVDGEVGVATLERVVGGLENPLAFARPGDNSNRYFVVEQAGRIRTVQGGVLITTPFLDIGNRVTNGGERGLLGVAFHPSYASNGRFFVDYVNTSGNTVIAEYHVSAANPNLADPASERILMTVQQPFANHKGGQLAFGPDGYLYIAMGDGGSGGDPNNNAQNKNQLLGKILRIDVNGAQPYAIPPSNPFVGVPNTKPEIFAYGFRNPWRFSFDRLNGRLFAGDVGQGEREEVDIVTSGANYGWRIMEGSNCFNPSSNCPTAGLTLPISEYGHNEGVAVIGGYVYRGDALSPFYGKYFFGDFGSSNVWTLEEQANGTFVRSLLLNAGFPISSFGEDDDGQLYVVNFGGEVYRLALR